MMNGIDIIKYVLRFISVILTILIFWAWSKYETNNWDMSRTSFKVWLTIVVLMVVGVFVWAWLP